MPRRKNGERPYPEPPKRPFWGPCMGQFSHLPGIYILCLYCTHSVHHSVSSIETTENIKQRCRTPRLSIYISDFFGTGAYTKLYPTYTQLYKNKRPNRILTYNIKDRLRYSSSISSTPSNDRVEYVEE